MLVPLAAPGAAPYSGVMQALLALALSALSTGAPDKHPLRVLVLVKKGDSRGEAFAGFLRERFSAVATADLNAFERTRLAEADVVLVDWQQSVGVLQWFKKKAEVSSPLGDRAAWTVPTVLIGSAGLNVAASWGVKGGSG
jgi:hypothetical protein